MHILFEIVGLVFLAAISIALFATMLLVIGAVGLFQTHNPIFVIPLLFGLLLASALD
jgi:hypothetical protein